MRFDQEFAVAYNQVSSLDFMVYIAKDMQDAITSLFYSKKIITNPNRSEWESWPAHKVVAELRPWINPGRQDKTQTERLIDAVTKAAAKLVFFFFYLNATNYHTKYNTSLTLTITMWHLIKSREGIWGVYS